MKKILLLGSQHGDELLGDLLNDYIKDKYPQLSDGIDFIIGNPKAKKAGVRFIESDLNRSYNGKKETYEEKRADELLNQIGDKSYDLVLDLHTTTCNQPPCIITASIIHPYIQSSAIEKIVHMNHTIVRTSLIGTCQPAISIEVNKQQINQAFLELLAQDIERFIHNKQASEHKDIYEVADLLRKSEIDATQAKTLQNFQKTPQGFYPVLVGENSYKKHTEYLGFKAYKVSTKV